MVTPGRLSISASEHGPRRLCTGECLVRFVNGSPQATAVREAVRAVLKDQVLVDAVARQSGSFLLSHFGVCCGSQAVRTDALGNQVLKCIRMIAGADGVERECGGRFSLRVSGFRNRVGKGKNKNNTEEGDAAAAGSDIDGADADATASESSSDGEVVDENVPGAAVDKSYGQVHYGRCSSRNAARVR